MNAIQAIFLDDGGVMNDNKCRAPQWRTLIAEYFRPRYGGNNNSWEEANTVAINKSIQRNVELAYKNIDFTTFNFKEFSRNDLIQWLIDMFEFMGIEPPPIIERESIIKDAVHWIIPRVRSAYPKVSETIHELKKRSYTLYTASGSFSDDLKNYLLGMDIKDCFQEFYGPDIINTPKVSKLYYERIFEHAHIDPKEALIVEDSIEKLLWAKSLGANVVLVNSSNEIHQLKISHEIKNLSEIIDIMDTF